MCFPFKLPMLLDGATATNLTADNMPNDVCVEKWILENPQKLIKLQNAYIKAGSQAIYAPTFGANRARLKKYGLENEVENINKKLVSLSRSIATPTGVLVGGSLCPTGMYVPPYGDADFDDIYDIYREQIRALEEAGVDFFIIETQTSLADMRAALLAARTTNLPVFVTITVNEKGKTLTGGSLLPTVITLQAMGADAVGLNCSCGPEPMVEFIKEVSSHTTVPIIAKPSAGVKKYLSPKKFAENMRPLIKAGAGIIGGCCGTTPEHIKELAVILKDFNNLTFPDNTDCYAAAIEKEAFFLSDDIVLSKPILCTSSLGDDLIDLEDERVNSALVKIESLDDVMLLCENSTMTTLPITVHCDSLPVLDAALRYFQGRLIVDSACMIEREIIEPLAIKYGAIIY